MNPDPRAKPLYIPVAVALSPLLAPLRAEDSLVLVLLFELEEVPAKFEREGNLAVLTSLPVQSEQEIIKIDIVPFQ